MKRLTQTLAFCLLTVFTAVAQKNYVSEVWVSDLGNGKYKNPVLYADYSVFWGNAIDFPEIPQERG